MPIIAHINVLICMTMFIVIFSSIALVALFFLLKKYKFKRTNLVQAVEQAVPQPMLVEAFSGDNRWDTELDLAKAYLELNQNEKAKHLLKSVIDHGAPHQILEARKMFSQLLKQERSA